ncbi:MAG: hypothetical protein M3N21_02635, partial [Actinomycetota bacterium]|nr:hypothetical protein [Actinomycetota bacterium]
ATAHGPDGRHAASHYRVTPKLFELNHSAGEPTIGITKQGYVAVTASAGCVTSCVGSTETVQTVAPGGRAVFLTRNKGRSWQNVSPGVAGVSPHALSLDPYLYVDHSPEANRIFDIDLNAACNELSYSDNFGATWITNPLSCGEPVNDHQTVFSGRPVSSPTVGYPAIVYYCFNKLAYTACTKSLDGGLTFLPTGHLTDPECSGLNGHGVTDSRGWVYLPYTGCNSTPTLAISKDEGTSWTIVHVSPGSKVNGGDPSVAIDKKDNLYYLWNDTTRRPMLSVSRNRGGSWSQAYSVAAPAVVRTNLATLTVGAPGSLAIAYYGTGSDADKGAFWNGYLAVGLGVLGRHPVFYSATVNDPRHPLKAGACGPGRCGRVLDFIDVKIAPDGQPWAAYVDACADVCEKTGVESLHDNAGVIGTLLGAPNLAR